MHLDSVSAISLDLDDTLWPFAPSVARAEEALRAWLVEQAPRTAPFLAAPGALARLRNEYEQAHPELKGDYRALRLGSIAAVLDAAREDASLTLPAYEVFYASRNQVEFFDDVLPALEWLKARFPLVAVTNGNAKLELTGCGAFFVGSLSAGQMGVAKPAAEIFHAAAALVSVKPAAMLHVGDDFDLDVIGATKAGLQAAWLLRHTDPSNPSTCARRGSHLTFPCLLTLCAALGMRQRTLPV